ncbi:helix-turn-helix domain-containing protein [Polaromonas sp.]|uniref:helix-turn-helix domain-containing protein n=1 Tax=Polaromonas sp. TaxID=1869339 RepID=UPI003BB5D70B
MKRARSMSKDEAVLHAQSGAAVNDSGSRLNPGAAGQPGAAGALLREARQSQGLDIATLAALLKVPVHKLEALEQDRFDLLPDPVFARALASSMCRVLKLDPAPVLHRLPAITAFKVTSQNRGINTPFRARSGRHAAPLWSHISRPAVLVGLALLLGALVLVFLPAIQQEFARYRQNGRAAVNPGQLAEPASVTTTVITPVPGSSDASGAVPGPSSSILTPVDVPAAIASVPETSPNALPAADVNSDATITFSAKRASRIKVTDAKGTVIMDRALRAAESASVSGAVPLAVVVNRADAVQVQVRSQAFDLAGVTRNNVARFEVK